MSTNGPGDKPRTVKVKAHTRTVKVKGDTKSNADLGRAKSFAKTPQAKRDLVAVYKQQPIKQRQAIQQHSTGDIKKAVARVHLQRVARNREITRAQAQHDVPTSADLARANRYLSAHPQILKPHHDPSLSVAGVGGALDGLLSGKTTAGLVSGAANLAGKAVTTIPTAGARIGENLSGMLGLGKSHNYSSLVKKGTTNFGHDLVDIPANAIPALYVPGKKALGGDPGGAAKMLAQPFVDLAKHPGKSFLEHPLGSALMLTGGIRGADRVAGRAQRLATGKAAARRPTASVPGTSLQGIREGSKGVVGRKLQARKDAKNPNPIMSDKELKRRVDENVSASEDIRRGNRAQVVNRASDVIANRSPGRGGRKERVKPSTATALISQNITRATREDLIKYRDELAAQHPSLGPAKARANKDLRAGIDKSLKNFHPGRQEVAARKYAELSTELQQGLVKRGLLDAGQAEKARLYPYAVRKMGAKHDGEQLTLNGKALTTGQIRAHMKANHVSEPAFLTHAPNQRGARNFFVSGMEPTKGPSGTRTGKAVVEGTADMHPDVLVENAARAQGLADSSDAYTRFIHEFSTKGSSGKPKQYKDFKGATQHAADLREVGGPEMVPVRLAPFAGKKAHLDKLLEGATDTRAPAWQDFHDALHSALKSDGDGTGGWTLVPRAARDQMQSHVKEMGSTTLGSEALGRSFNLYGSLFRKTVLATNPKWLVGNTVEAAGRSLIGGAGPTSLLTAHKVLKWADQNDPALATEIRARITGGGHYSLAARNSLHTNAEQFANTQLAGVARGLGAFWRAPGPKHLAHAWGAFTNFVFNDFNGRIEGVFQTAQFGKALRESKLMDGSIVKLSATAVEQAGRGLKNTHEMVELGRQVDRMYGKYGKFSPGMKRAVASYTPFIAWTLNATRFVLDVLPKDHPIATAVLASANQATEEWRKDHGLVSWAAGAAPGWLQGSTPTKGGGHLRVSRFTPFGAFDNEGNLGGTYADSVLPQFQGVLANLKGKDWKGKDLPPGSSTYMTAAQSFIESSVPVVAQVHRLSNRPGNVLSKLNQEFNPALPVKGRPAQGGASTTSASSTKVPAWMVSRAKASQATQQQVPEWMIRRAKAQQTP